MLLARLKNTVAGRRASDFASPALPLSCLLRMQYSDTVNALESVVNRTV